MPAPKGILRPLARPPRPAPPRPPQKEKVRRKKTWTLDKETKVLVNPGTLKEAGKQHFDRRDKAEVDQILDLKCLQEAGLFSLGAVVTQGPAIEQLIRANPKRKWTPRPDWMPKIDDRDTREWAHEARLQPMVNAIPLQYHVPAVMRFLQSYLLGHQGAVGQMTRMHNWLNSRIDRDTNPEFIADLNALLTIRAPLTRERVIAIQQNQRRIKIRALIRVLNDVREWLHTGQGNKAENEYRLQFILEELEHSKGPLASEILPADHVGNVREFFREEFAEFGLLQGPGLAADASPGARVEEVPDAPDHDPLDEPD